MPSGMAKIPATRDSLTVTQTPQAMGPAVQPQLHIQGIAEEDGVPFGQLGALGGDGLTTAGVEIVLQEELPSPPPRCRQTRRSVSAPPDRRCTGNALPAPGVIHRLHGLVDADMAASTSSRKTPCQSS